MTTPFRLFYRMSDWKDHVHIQKTTHAGDDAGGNTTIVRTVKRFVPCVVVSSGEKESNAFTRLGIEQTHTVTLPFDPEVRNGDRMLFAGRLLIVQSCLDEHNQHLIWTVVCTETKA